jgi:dUTP pyrophosphatase
MTYTPRIQKNIKIVNKSGNPLPKYAHMDDSGLDICAFLEEDLIIKPGERALVQTGIYVAIPDGYELQVRSRSGLALKKGIFVLNSPGTIDAGYRNSIGVILYNSSKDDFTVKNGDRIAQLVLQAVPRVVWQEVESLDDTERGMGGYGSSGV